jgi:hypothetical protein
MKVLAFLLGATAAIALASFALPAKGKVSHEISMLETLAKKMERAKQISPETEQTVTRLIELVRAEQIQAGSKLEKRRQAAISHTERILARTATLETAAPVGSIKEH